ncbi:MAG: biotin/lipoyl-containing protein [Leptospirales bacterium]
MKKKIDFMDTSFRDGFQSYFGARVLTEDFIPAIQAAVDAGINHFEAGGGARFQSLFMYCGESAFDMMDKFRETVGPDAKLQTLARGISVVALNAQPRDMIDLHAKLFKKHGMTNVRNFDALNDVQNLEYSGQAIHNAGLKHQVSVTLMELPAGLTGSHDPEFYIATLKKILDSGLPFDSIAFKDSTGTANPNKVFETVKGARKLVGDDIKLWIHSHDTAGVGITQYKAAVEGGIDGLCLARSPVSGGTSQPDLIAMWHALKGTDYSLDIDPKKILEANAIFKEALSDYFFPPEALGISPEVIFSPMPGGALTANTMMMRDTGTLDLYPKVIDAMGECVAKGGYGTSVTPVSQFYFQQAYANVTQGPWKKITDGYGRMVLGYFGKTPVNPDPEVVKIAAEQMQLEPFSGNPLDILEPGIPAAKEILIKEGLETTDENIFIVGALATEGGNKGLDFLKGNYSVNVRKISTEPAPRTPTKTASGSSSGVYTVTVDGKSYEVGVQEGTGSVQSIQPKSAAPASEGQIDVQSQVPGNVYNILVSPGDEVSEGDVLIILEAMKMETPVAAPASGTVESIHVEKGEVVESGQVLCTLS